MSKKSILWPSLVYLSKWRLSYLAGIAMAFSLDTIDFHRDSKNSKYKILVLRTNKSGVAQDIRESFQEADEISFHSMPSYSLKAISNSILHSTISHNNYLSSDSGVNQSKREYREFLSRAWSVFSWLNKFDAVISVNFGYYPERELAAALEERGIPFIVLHKENLNGISKKRADFWKEVYKNRRGRFSGRAILVYNKMERDLQISSGVVSSEEIHVVGMPRLDKIHRWRKMQTDSKDNLKEKHILFFAFGRVDKLPAIRRKLRGHAADPLDEQWKEFSWAELCEGAHKAIVDLAHRRPDLKVVVKTKGRSGQGQEIYILLNQDPRGIPPNLEIVSGGDPFSLIANAQLVIGFNTTAILEALAAGKPVVVPRFGEALREEAKDLAIDMGKSVLYAESPQELVKLACKLADDPRPPGTELAPEVSKILDHFVGNADGNAGQKVYQAVMREIKAKEIRE